MDVLCKPGASYTIGALADDIAQRIVAVAGRKIQVRKSGQSSVSDRTAVIAKNLSTTTNMIIGIGASTGGTVALEEVITALPPPRRGGGSTTHAARIHQKFFRAFE